MKPKLWKIYFILILILSVPTYFLQGFYRIWEIIDFIVFLIAMMGLFGFAWRKKLISKLFWQIFFSVQLVWNFYYLYFLPLPQKVFEIMENVNGSSQFAVATLTFVIFSPLIIALYLYAFKYFNWK